MAIGPLSFRETVSDTAPGSASFTIDNAEAVLKYDFDATAPTDVEDAIVFFEGETNVSISAQGNINRLTPTAHPQHAYLYAYKAMAQGLVNKGQVPGGFTKTASTLAIDSPPMPYFTLYPKYHITVNFGPRPYSCLNDSYTTPIFGQWTNFAGNLQHFNYAPEWLRYLDWELLPQGDSVTAQQGSMQFSNTGASNSNVFAGMPRVFLPNSVLRIIWYNVPARFLYSANSYLMNHQWQGCINQSAWPPNPGANGLQFPAGSLLYVNSKPTKYTPSIRQTAPLPDNPNITSVPKLMNLELTFIYTSRTAPVGETATQTNIVSSNMIPKGHNLLPWHVDRRFHYAQTKTGGAKEYASFYSFPMELLFTDPDSTVTMYDGVARLQASVINNDGAAL